MIRSMFWLLLPLCCMVIGAQAQDPQPSLQNLGDSAPPLRMRAWVKGPPVEKLIKGRVYVLEFWASWCKPCVAGMPHLSELARKYRDRVTVLGIDIYEKRTTSLEKITAFVDSMGDRMDFQIAVGDSNFIAGGWIEGFGEQRSGIPRSFVVDSNGRIAWIGYPTQLDEVLPGIVNGTWDIGEARTTRDDNRRLAAMDDSLSYELMRFREDPFKVGDRGNPDSALLLIAQIVKTEPKLKYAPLMGSHTFISLLKTSPHKAYEFGKVAIVTSTYQEPDYHLISGAIELYWDKLKLPAEIYRLGAEACQAEIDHRLYPESVSISRFYHKMAEFYWRANDKAKAIDAAQKAIEVLRTKRDFSRADMASYQSQLQRYRRK